MNEPAERLLPHGADVHRNVLTTDHGFVDAPLRPLIAPGRALEQFHRRSDRLAVGRVRKRISRILEEQLGGIGDGARGIERGLAQFVQPVKRRRKRRCGIARQRGGAIELPDR
jgi:hypothetical protein